MTNSDKFVRYKIIGITPWGYREEVYDDYARSLEWAEEEADFYRENHPDCEFKVKVVERFVPQP